MNIYVGNLSSGAMETDLKDLFSPFGNIISVKIVTDNFTNNARGFAFVEMREREEGELAVQQLHDRSLMGKSLIVRESSLKETTRSW